MDTASGQRDPEGMGRLSAARRPEQQATAQGGHGGSMPPPSNGLDEPRAGAAPARGDGTAHEGDAHRRRPPRGGRGGRRHRRVRTTGTPVSAPAPTGPVRTCISTQNLFIVGCDDRGMLTTPAPDRRGEARRSARRWGTANQSRPAPPPRVAMPPPARGRPTVMGDGWAARHRGLRRCPRPRSGPTPATAVRTDARHRDPRRPARHRGLRLRPPPRSAPTPNATTTGASCPARRLDSPHGRFTTTSTGNMRLSGGRADADRAAQQS